MKTYKNPKLAFLTLFSTLLCSCLMNDYISAQQEKREVSDFTQIKYSLPCSIEIKQGDVSSLTLEGSNEVLSKIITKVEDGTLKIYTEDHVSHLGEVKVYLTVVNLEKFFLSGSGDAAFQSALKVKDIVFDLSGSGDMKIPQLTADDAELKISGSGNINISGLVGNKLDVSITGSGDIKASDLKAKDAIVKITGSGSVEVYAEANLKTNIVGSGSVHYKGKPLIDAQTVGSGSTKPL
jgi:hypothetical protein